MLQLQNICKQYTTGDFTQIALNDVSVSFRDNEFVAILGPSGSGKTTLLNMIGGLDHYDSGNMIIDGISTKDYKDRDWDTFRNNRVGFVFQSYNLIPHQTVLSNVELALTLSGVAREERRQRAKEALERVGLGDHINKKPNQLSGGQMQRVAIARALINDPEILLADEPTGALDSKTSVQIMDLLTEIANDRLVVMVTHNPDLAEQYSTRIVTLSDGCVVGDTDPYNPTEEEMRLSDKEIRRTSMSFLTALSLSANNLWSKKGRTIMVAIAGSIGIIGIAAILALANGVNDYIASIEEDTLSMYPIQITSSSFDMSSMMSSMGFDTGDADSSPRSDSSEADERDENSDEIGEFDMLTRMFSSISSNDLESLKEYLDSGESDIDDYVHSIEYLYDVTPQIFAADTGDGVRQINPDTSFSALGIGNLSTNSIMSMAMSTDIFSEMVSDTSLVEEQYDVVAGHWPENYDECVLVLTSTGAISDFTSYVLGLRNQDDLQTMVRQFINDEEIEVPDDEIDITYDDILNLEMKLVSSSDYYQYDEEYNVWVDKSGDEEYMANLVENGENIVISGIVQPKPGATVTSLSSGIYYTTDLTQHIIDKAGESQIVKDQVADPTVDVFSGRSFAEIEEEEENSSPFDLNSIFTIDTDALNEAFSINTDDLTVDMSNIGSDMDLSNMDFNIDMSGLGLDIDMSDLAEGLNLDMSDLGDNLNLDFDLSDMNFDLDIPMDDFSLSDMMSDIDLSSLNIDAASLINQDALFEATAALTAGYLENAASIMAENPNIDPTDFNQLLQIYFQSDSAQSIFLSYLPQVVDMTGMQNVIETQMQSIMQTYATQMMSSYAEQMSTALQSQLQSALTEAMSSYMDQISAEISTSIQSAIETQLQDAMTNMMNTYMSQITSAIGEQIESAMADYMDDLANNMSAAMNIDPDNLSDIFGDAFEFNMDEDELSELIMSLMSSDETTYDGNLSKLGYADLNKPMEIDIYPSDFENKEKVEEILDDYNTIMANNGEEEKQISYTDLVGTLMSSVTTIVDMVSYVLIAFVAISLVVSSIMIGVITYISVLERRKEIGILRAIGASKGNVALIFDAETIIEGLIAGVFGVGVTALACIPISALVYAIFDVPNVAQLPLAYGLLLILISVALTFIAGLIPATSASRKDPVEALRSE